MAGGCAAARQSRRMMSARRARCVSVRAEGGGGMRMRAGRAAVGVPVMRPAGPKNEVVEVAASKRPRRLELFEFFDERPPSVHRQKGGATRGDLRRVSSVAPGPVAGLSQPKIFGVPAAALLPLFFVMFVFGSIRRVRQKALTARPTLLLGKRGPTPGTEDQSAVGEVIDVDLPSGSTESMAGDDVSTLVLQSVKENAEIAATATKDAWMELRERWILPLAGHTTRGNGAAAAAAAAKDEDYDSVEAASRALQARLWILSWRSKHVDCLMETDGCRGKDFELLAYETELKALSSLDGRPADAEAAAGIVRSRAVDCAAVEQRISAWSKILTSTSDAGADASEASRHINLAVETWARCAQAWLDAKNVDEPDALRDVSATESASPVTVGTPAEGHADVTVDGEAHKRAGGGVLSFFTGKKTGASGKDAAMAISMEHSDAHGAERTISEAETDSIKINLDPIVDFKKWLAKK